MAKVFDVFISYRRSDGAELAQTLYEYLTGKGLRVFLDRIEMEKGKYFDRQLWTNVIGAPSYILIATPDVFPFKEKKDYVKEEIRTALKEYENSSDEDRVFLPVVVPGTVYPDGSELGEDFENIDKPHRHPLTGNTFTDSDLLTIFKKVSGVSQRNLWNAGQRWLENSRKEGARFHSLDIVDTILPRAKKKTKKTQTPSCPSM